MTLKQRLQNLESLTIIEDIQRLNMDDHLLNQIDKQWQSLALKNDRELYIYQIVYRSQGHKVMGYLVEPRRGTQLPCLVYNRGGTGDFGALNHVDAFMRLARYASWGYVVIASQYSGNGGSEGVDEIGGGDVEDVINLYKILRPYEIADHKRIGMFGGSRGGMMTYQCMRKVKWIKAAITVCAVSDEVRMKKLRPEYFNQIPFKPTMAELKKRSSIYWVDQMTKKAPVLMIHGTADWRVSVLDSLDLARKFYEHKVPYRLLVLEGEEHFFSKFKKEMHEETKKWLDKFVKNREKLPNLNLHGK